MTRFQYDDGAMPQAGGPTTRANWSPYVRAPRVDERHLPSSARRARSSRARRAARRS